MKKYFLGVAGFLHGKKSSSDWPNFQSAFACIAALYAAL